MGEFKTYTKTEYAKIKGVSRPYISKLVKQGKLLTYLCPVEGKYKVIDCEQNDNRFKK